MGTDAQSNEEVLRSMFSAVLTAPELDEDAVAEHFDPRYEQRVDGHTLDYDGFLDHMRALKSAVARSEIEIEELIADGDELCTVHHVTATKRDGGEMSGDVIAYWRLEAGRIVACKELTRMTSGSPEDRDLGSRT